MCCFQKARSVLHSTTYAAVGLDRAVFLTRLEVLEPSLSFLSFDRQSFQKKDHAQTDPAGLGESVWWCCA